LRTSEKQRNHDLVMGDGCEIVVVGGGSAGCAMAARLSDGGRETVLLEAGKSDVDLRLLVPALTMAVVHNPDYDWSFDAEADPSIGGRVDKWPAGKRLGGSSAINGMIYVRGHKWDYDRWAQLGASGWASADVAPYFRRIETNSRGGDEVRGDAGPISVSDNRVDYPVVQAFVESAVSYGIFRNSDHNGIRAGEGTDFSQTSQRGGLRCSAARGYLRNERPRRNLRVRTQVIVRRILIENGRAVGVEYDQSGQTRTLRSSRGVVLSAGTINTPRLLMLSGVGPARDLQALGIEVVADSPGVGANLQEHVGTHIVARVNTATVNTDTRGLRAVWQGLDFLLRRRGALTSSMCHAQAFVRTEPDLPVPDVQISCTAFAFDLNEVGRAVLSRDASISLTVVCSRPESRGFLSLRSADPLAPPIIRHQLLGANEDVERLARGVKIGRGILAQPAMARHITEIVRPGAAENGAALRDYLRRFAVPLYHPVGTCRMGRDPDAVVDPDLRVRGVDKLWIADASVMPTIPSGNTNATAIMIGDKGADHVLKTCG
jgi:choline dehydrogenase